MDSHQLGGQHDRASGKDPAADAVGHAACCADHQDREAQQRAAEEAPPERLRRRKHHPAPAQHVIFKRRSHRLLWQREDERINVLA